MWLHEQDSFLVGSELGMCLLRWAHVPSMDWVPAFFEWPAGVATFLTNCILLRATWRLSNFPLKCFLMTDWYAFAPSLKMTLPFPACF